MSRSEKQKMLAGDYYDTADPELVAERTACRYLLREFNLSTPEQMERRTELLAQLLGKTGADYYIEPPFFCDYGGNIEVGENFYANFGCTLLDVAAIKLGDNVQLAPGVHIYTATHPLDPELRRSGAEYGLPVTLGNNVWVGGNAVICPGIMIGDNAVIGAGAVVTKDVAENLLVGGNPARIIKAIPNGG